MQIKIFDTIKSKNIQRLICTLVCTAMSGICSEFVGLGYLGYFVKMGTPFDGLL